MHAILSVLVTAFSSTFSYTNSRIATKFSFPRLLTECSISTIGKEGILNKSVGLQNLGVPAGHSSPSLRIYHADNFKKGIYSKDFDQWFPASRVAANPIIGYDQGEISVRCPVKHAHLTNSSLSALVLDLHPFKSDEQIHLTVSMRYSGDSPRGMVLRAVG